MEGLWDKYSRIKEVFYRDFVYDSSYTEQASCIPLSSVKNGVGWVGDGTINLAQYLQFLYTEIILGNRQKMMFVMPYWYLLALPILLMIYFLIVTKVFISNSKKDFS